MQNKSNIADSRFSVVFQEQMKNNKYYSNCLVRVKSGLDSFFGKEDYTIGEVSEVTPFRLQAVRPLGKKSVDAIKYFMMKNGFWGGRKILLQNIAEVQLKMLQKYDTLIEGEKDERKMICLMGMRDTCVRNYLDILNKNDNADNQEGAPMGSVQ